MYMEPNDPKETADDTNITEDWQDPDFGGYPIEDDDDWPSVRCSFFLKPMTSKDEWIAWLAQCPVKAIRNDELNFGDHEDAEEINYSFYIPNND